MLPPPCLTVGTVGVLPIGFDWTMSSRWLKLRESRPMFRCSLAEFRLWPNNLQAIRAHFKQLFFQSCVFNCAHCFVAHPRLPDTFFVLFYTNFGSPTPTYLNELAGVHLKMKMGRFRSQINKNYWSSVWFVDLETCLGYLVRGELPCGCQHIALVRLMWDGEACN